MASLPAEAFNLYGSHAEQSSPAQARLLSRIKRHTEISSKLTALVGLALFGCAMVVAFRIIALDAAQQLQQPAIDFALCGAVGFLGLSISWVHLGNRSVTQIGNAFAGAEPAAPESTASLSTLPASADAQCTPQLPAPSAPLVSHSRRPVHKNLQRLLAGTHLCPFCGQKMMHVAATQYQCQICRHCENRAPKSFLDSATDCSCTHCRQDSRQAS